MPTHVAAPPPHPARPTAAAHRTSGAAARWRGGFCVLAAEVVVLHGLWGEKSETAARNYIDRSYPIQPYTALVFDFLLDVGQAAVIMAI
eukprot:COSAG01_NODE_5058_length_4519_cov_16.982127_3_plen_89_part_00